MLFIMTSRAHSCGYVAIMVYYCYVVPSQKYAMYVWSGTLHTG